MFKFLYQQNNVLSLCMLMRGHVAWGRRSQWFAETLTGRFSAFASSSRNSLCPHGGRTHSCTPPLASVLPWQPYFITLPEDWVNVLIESLSLQDRALKGSVFACWRTWSNILSNKGLLQKKKIKFCVTWFTDASLFLFVFPVFLQTLFSSLHKGTLLLHHASTVYCLYFAKRNIQ